MGGSTALTAFHKPKEIAPMAIQSSRPENHPAYTITRRTHHKKNPGRDLSGFAMDVVLRVNGDGKPFVQDLNAGYPMPMDEVEEAAEFIKQEIVRNAREHFGTP
jgi:hypothetical protein